jgi:hypothetical protein
MLEIEGCEKSIVHDIETERLAAAEPAHAQANAPPAQT